MPAAWAGSFSGSNYLSRSQYVGNAAAFSVACWVNLNTNQLSRIFFSNFNNSSGKGWANGISDSTNNKLKLYDGTGTLFQTGALTAGVWTFVLHTHDGTTGKVYLNGNTTADATVTEAITYSGTPVTNYIGCLQGVNQMLNGLLSGVAPYSRALTGAEGAALYNGGAGMNFADLSGSLLTSLQSYHDFSDASDLGADSSGGGHGFINNGAVTRAAGPGVGGPWPHFTDCALSGGYSNMGY